MDTLDVYQYTALTAWDIVWTLLIASGGLGFLGFCAFVAFRFNRWIKYEQMEREQAAKEKEMLELKRKAKANGSAAAAKKAAAEEKAAFERQLREQDDGDDVADGAMFDLVNQLAVSYKKQYGSNGGGDGGTSVDGSSSNNMSPDRHHAESEAFTAPTDRVPLGESQLGPASIDGRQALNLHHGDGGNGPGSPPRERTAVESYLDRIVLPPSGAPATYIAGVDSKVHAPPPSLAATAAGGGGASSPSSKAPPSSAAPTTSGAGKQSLVGTSQVGGFQSGHASPAKAGSPTTTTVASTAAAAGGGGGGTTPGGTAFSKADMDEL